MPQKKMLFKNMGKGENAGKLNANQYSEFVFHRIENIVRIGENAGNKHFLLLSQCFL